MKNTLGPGDVRVGRIIDGVDDSLPDQSATLTFKDEWGAELAIPFFVNPDGGPNPPYDKTHEWFGFPSGTLPSTLIFEDDRGVVTLTKSSFAGVSGAMGQVGRVRAQAAIFGRPRSHEEEYLIANLISRIDGLAEFTGFRPIAFDHERGENNRYTTTVTISANESVEWEIGDFRYTIRSNVAWHGTAGQNFVIDDSSPFISTFGEIGATLFDHLAAQRAVRGLLSIVFGEKVAWRSHELIDREFPAWMFDGTDLGPIPVETQIRSTVAQHRAPLPKSNAFAAGMFNLKVLGASGMQKWIELYSIEEFRQAVQPTVEVINGATRFLEPQLMMLAISLDRFGYYRSNDKRRRPMRLIQNGEMVQSEATVYDR